MTVIKNWIPSLIVMGVIFIISATPGETINSIGLGKESYHINGHFFLFLLLYLTFFKATKGIITSVILSFLYSVTDEIHQSFVPLRSMSIFDIYVDSVGIILGAVIIWKLQFLLPKKLKNWLLN